MCISKLTYRLEKFFERKASSPEAPEMVSDSYNDDRLWISADEDDFLKECIRETKRLWQEYQKTGILPDWKNEKETGADDDLKDQ